MAFLDGVFRFRVGLALSLPGLSAAVVGTYWDPLNGRELAAAGIGLLQALLMAGGAVLCVLGAVLMALPRREPPPARPVRAAAMRSTDGRRTGRSGKKRARRARRRNKVRR